MKRLLSILILVFLITGCSNNNTKPASGQASDSTSVRDSTSNPKYNPASPPAQNSQ